MEHITNSVLVQGATLEDIERIVNKAIDKRMEAFYKAVCDKKPILMKRKDAASFLGVSLPTLDAYSKAGVIHANRVGGRVFFDQTELSGIRGKAGRSHFP